MKKILVIILLTCIFSPNILSAQDITISADWKKAEKIIDVPETTKDELYIIVNSWAVENFVYSESVIEFRDKDAGKIVGKYTFSYNQFLDPCIVMQTIMIDIKDNKIRIIIKDPYIKLINPGWAQRKGYYPAEKDKTLWDTKEKWIKLINSLENYLKSKDDNSDW